MDNEQMTNDNFATALIFIFFDKLNVCIPAHSIL